MNFKLRNIVAATLAGTFLMGFGATAMADSTFDLVQALINKGVLTEEEGLALMKGKETEDRDKKKASVSTKFKDGFSIESGDGANKFSINGRIQLDYRNFDTSENTTSAQANNADTFDIRRAYLGAKGTFLKYYDFEVTADFAGQSNTSHLDVAYMNIKWWQQANFQFGQFKMPFSLEERTSSRFVDFQERSFVNNGSLVPGKERGIMVHGTPFTGVNYALAFSNGAGKNTNETDNREDGKDVIVHADANIAEMMGNKDMVIHLGASYTQGDLPVAALSSQRTEGRGVQFFSTAAFTGADMERTRTGLEGAVAYGPFKVQAEWAQASFEGTSSGNVSYDRELDAYYAEALWLITGETYASAYKGGKFDRIKPTTNFDPQDKGMGAWEVGVRYSKFDASDFKTTNAVGTGVLTGTNEADAWTLGLKWIVNPNMRVMINYVDTDFDTPVTLGGKVEDGEKAITMRTQFDF
ncbi:MAG: porin [Methylophilus sp.]|nr:porin [Methylophilus sp.]